MTVTSAEFRPINRSEHLLLVVDDDPASRYATTRRLGSAGFRTCEAASGADALRMADENISAVVLDIHLPDIDGFELCRLLRERSATARTPVLHLSAAFVTDEDKVRGLDAGADAYLTHPVEPAVLVATVQALVRTRIAEEAMRASESKFRTIYNKAPGGICLLDTDGRFIDANPTLLGFLQRTLNEVLNQRLMDFVAPDDATAATGLVEGIARGSDTRAEFSLIDAHGRAVALEWSLSAEVDPGVSMALATDIRERVQLDVQRRQSFERERDARTEAEHLNRMKDEFIAVASHELRSPLNAMMGWAHVLQRRGGDSAQLATGLAAIERNGKAQARLISDLLDMSRLNIGKMPLAKSSIDALEVVQSTLLGLGGEAGVAGVGLRVESAPRLPLIQADAARLQQVVWNLVSNSIKFSSRGGEVTVRLATDNEGIRIAVEDRGQGIAPEFLPHIFERFSQADMAHQRSRGGLGLGLSIVQQLVQAHGGTVSAHSEGKGRGATFEVWLPIGGPSSDMTAPGSLDDVAAAPADLSLEGLRLMVVDDDPEALNMLQIILADRGAEVTVASHYEEALAKLPSARADLILSDIGLPGKDGYELMHEIRRREVSGQHIPAIALTSFSQPRDRAQAIAAGFDLHSSKPVRPLHLVQLILELAGKGVRNQQS